MPDTNRKLWLTVAWLGSHSIKHHLLPSLLSPQSHKMKSIYICLATSPFRDDSSLHCNGTPGTTLAFLSLAYSLIQSSACFSPSGTTAVFCNKLWQR